MKNESSDFSSYFVHQTLVDFGAFLVSPPTPFVEVLADADDVYHHEFQTLSRSACEGVVNGVLRVEQREVFAVHSSCEVYVLAVQEELLIEESRLPYRVHSQEHEAAGEEWYVKYLRESRLTEFARLVASSYEYLRQAEASEEIEWGREHACQALYLSVRVHYLRHHLSYVLVFIHVFRERRNHLRTEPYVRVDHEVVFAARLQSRLQCYVVTTAVTIVLVGQIYKLETALCLCLELRFALQYPFRKLLQLCLEIEHAVGVVYHVYRSDRRCKKASKYRFEVKQVMIICYYRGGYHVS